MQVIHVHVRFITVHYVHMHMYRYMYVYMYICTIATVLHVPADNLTLELSVAPLLRKLEDIKQRKLMAHGNRSVSHDAACML